MGKNKLFVNADTELLYYVYVSNKANTNSFERALKSYAKGYAKKGITDFLATCFCQNSFFPSKIMPWAGNKFYQKEENGVKVDYTEHERIKCLVDIYSNIKSDPFEILIKEFKKHKINAWLSVRMNDSHCQLEETSFLRSEHFYQAKENGWTVNQSAFSPYFENCLDYGVKEVRDRMLSYLFEILDKFDVDGLELDFQRELFCFDYVNNADCHLIMTEFIEKLRIYASQKEKERGHKIKIGVRLCGDIEHNKIFGFDVKTWVEKGLIDVVVPTSRWENTDSNLPIKEWKKIIANRPVELMAGLELFLFQPYVNSVETIKGFATQYLEAGVDGIYLFNWFRTRCGNKEITQKELNSIKNIKICLYNEEFGSNEQEKNLRKIWWACSNVKNAKSGERSHVMTFQEDCVVPKGKKACRPFPCEVVGEKTFTMQTGTCNNSACTLYVGIERGGKIEGAIVDKKRAVYLGITQNAVVQNPIIDGDFPPYQKELLTTEYLAFEFESGFGCEREITIIGECKLLYIEVAVNELNFKKVFPKNGYLFDTYKKEQKDFIENDYKFGIKEALKKLNETKLDRDFSFSKPIILRWKNQGEKSTIEISEFKNFKNATTLESENNFFVLDNLKTDKKYYWRVNGGKTLCFKTKKRKFRFISIDGLRNVRDLGGIKIRQGLIYRGSELNSRYEITEKGKNTFANRLKIKTDLDIRAEAVNLFFDCPVGKQINYIQLPYRPYLEIFEEEHKKGICKIMEVFANKDNYPIYVHCYGGADRTGMLAMFLRAIAGEKEKDLLADYELTSLAKVQDSLTIIGEAFRNRNSKDFAPFYSEIKKFAPNKSLKEQIIAYLFSCGVTKECINKIRKIIKK